MYAGFLALAGNELVNSVRAATYAEHLGITSVQCGQCPTLPRALWDDPYSSPDMDDAPWFDPAAPHSKEFAGFVGLEITGLSRTTAHRDVVALTSDGAALHPLRRSHKEIHVQAEMLAKTECALSYGFSWLASALRGGICGAGCTGDSLCFFTCCPTGCDPLLPGDDPDQPDCCRPAPDVMALPDPCGTAYWRQMFNVGLLDMEEPKDIKRIPGGWIAEVNFTLAAGNPLIYREPLLIASGDNPPPVDILPGYDPNITADCVESTDCLRDPTCPPPPAPILPPVPVDACFPTGTFTAARAMVPLPAGLLPIWAEKVPLIIIQAGSKRLERLIFRWYGNPTERDCRNNLNPCAACTEMQIGFVPAGATLTIDGRIEAAFVDCPGGPGLATAEPQLYGPGGRPFVWPVFNCADAMCLEVIAKADTVAPDSKIDIYYVVREDSA